MNKKQELRRNFKFLSIFGYSLILGNGWIIATAGILVSLSNGGTAGTIWMYLIIITGSAFSCLSMAEMAVRVSIYVHAFKPCERSSSYHHDDFS